jgi:CRP/FNR family transcriptional regulator, anaerobic regulatory protein
VQPVEKFFKQYHTKRFAKGELILVQGEVPTCAYVVKKGIVKTYNLTSEGDEKPIMYDMQNEVMPIGWVFHKLKHAIYFYEAFTDVELYCVPRDEYVDYLKKNPKTMFDAYTHLVGTYVNHQMRINALEQSKAASKVLNTIHFLCLRFGLDVKNDVVKIELPLTQQELANFMGLTRETTGIELKKLQRKGILTYRRQNYIVRTDKLNELLDEDYDIGFMPE